MQFLVIQRASPPHALSHEPTLLVSMTATPGHLVLLVGHPLPFLEAANTPLAYAYPPTTHTLSRSIRGSDVAVGVARER
jgi:hypothetical protein